MNKHKRRALEYVVAGLGVAITATLLIFSVGSGDRDQQAAYDPFTLDEGDFEQLAENRADDRRMFASDFETDLLSSLNSELSGLVSLGLPTMTFGGVELGSREFLTHQGPADSENDANGNEQALGGSAANGGYTGSGGGELAIDSPYAMWASGYGGPIPAPGFMSGSALSATGADEPLSERSKPERSITTAPRRDVSRDGVAGIRPDVAVIDKRSDQPSSMDYASIGQQSGRTSSSPSSNGADPILSRPSRPERSHSVRTPDVLATALLPERELPLVGIEDDVILTALTSPATAYDAPTDSRLSDAATRSPLEAPEPGTLALVGLSLALAGFGYSRLKR